MNTSTIPFLKEIKEHYGLDEFDEGTDVLPINRHFVEILPINSSDNPVLLLTTSVCNTFSLAERETQLEKIVRGQELFLDDHDYALAIDPDKSFIVLQKIIYPNDAEAIFEAIDQFTSRATAAELYLNFSVTNESMKKEYVERLSNSH